MVGYGFPLVSICFPIAFDGEGGLRSRCSPSLYRTMPPFKEKIETQRKAIEKEMVNNGGKRHYAPPIKRQLETHRETKGNTLENKGEPNRRMRGSIKKARGTQ